MKKERPILFSTPMIQALLAGRKTQTRRKIKGVDDFDHNWSIKGVENCPGYYSMRCGTQYTIPYLKCPYGHVGDILWVRETWLEGFEWDGYGEQPPTEIYYRADGKAEQMEWYDEDREDGIRNGPPWKPSIHMKKEIARIWLETIEIRAERVQDISEEDALAEGILYCDSEILGRRYKDYLADASGYGHPDHDYPTVGSAVTSYGTLWSKINGIESWKANDWVWAITSKVLSTTGRPDNL